MPRFHNIHRGKGIQLCNMCPNKLLICNPCQPLINIYIPCDVLCNKVFRKRFLRPSSPSKNSSYFSEAICFTPFPRPIFLRAGNQYFCQNNSRRWHFAISGRTEVVGANFCWFFHGESSARAECGSLAGNEGSGRRKYKYKYRYKYAY